MTTCPTFSGPNFKIWRKNLKNVFFENLKNTFWDSLKKTMTDNFGKKIDEKVNCGRWSENFDVALPDEITCLHYLMTLPVTLPTLFFYGKSVWSNIKFELNVSMKLWNLKVNTLISQY